MAFFTIQLLTGLAGASSLFLVASGLTVIFGVTRVVNFAHGSLVMLGAYIGFTILSRVPREPAWFVLGAAGAALAVALIGVLIEVSLLRRIYRAPELFQLLATFGVVLIVQDAVEAIWGADDLSLSRPPFLRASFAIEGERFPAFDIFLVALGPLTLLALWVVFTRTRWGLLVRAATLDREMLGALGVDQRTLFTTVFALGAGLAGLGGCLMLADRSASAGIDVAVLADAFVVVVVGGLGSILGSFAASVLIGVSQAFGVVLLPRATLVLIFVVMAVVLAVRPNGLLGREAVVTRAPAGPDPLVRPAPRTLRIAGAIALIAAIAAPFAVGPFALSILTEAAIVVLFAASLHLMMGPGGMASFGHAAWFGIGAYGAALMAGTLGMPVSLVAATLLAGVAAFAFGLLVARLSGVYLAMLTLAFAQIVWAVAFQWGALTGGDNGLLGIRPSSWAASPAVFYWLALAVSVGGAMLLRIVIYAPLGYAIRAARDSAQRAEAIGLPTARLRVAAVTLAGAAAGLSGALYAFDKQSVFPTYIGIPRSVDALVMVLLGGVGAITGPIVGAVAYTGLFDFLLVATDHWRAALGAAIVALILAFPDGIAGAVARLVRRA